MLNRIMKQLTNPSTPDGRRFCVDAEGQRMYADFLKLVAVRRSSIKVDQRPEQTSAEMFNVAEPTVH